MATSAQGSGSLRRGLPRVHGGEPWPAEGIVAVSDAEIDAGEHDTSGLITAQDGSPAGAGGGASAQGSTPGLAQPDAGVAVALGAGAVVSPDAGVAESSGVASEAAAASGGVRLRQGLPREAVERRGRLPRWRRCRVRRCRVRRWVRRRRSRPRLLPMPFPPPRQEPPMSRHIRWLRMLMRPLPRRPQRQ